MKTMNCRVCQSEFLKEPLLKYENMPAQAQGLPEKKDLSSDRGITLELYQCSGCGLVQLSSEPVSYYKEVIRAAAFSPEMGEFRKKQFKHFVHQYSLEGKKVLEIGCGKGEYLSLMQQAGVKGYGIEYGKDSVNACLKSGLNVSKEYIDDISLKLPSAPFDAFFILNYLEHMPEPVTSLKGMWNNLSEGAIGLVEVPNFDMILSKNLFSEFIPDHLFYFTKETLQFALQMSGFEILEIKDVWHDYIISAQIRKRKQVNVSHFYSTEKKIKADLVGFLNKHKSVAVWGAGHQSLAIIALTNIAKQLQYVVDSAPFKQGKFTAATHVPIVSPEMLVSNPVEAIIVMAASYSDEVAETIKKRFGNKMAISILRDFGLENC